MQRTPHTSSHGKQHPSKLTLKMKSRFKNKSSFQKWKEILKGSHDIIVIHRRFTHICFLHVMNLIHIYLESQQIQNKRGFYVMYWTIPFCYWCHTGGKAKVDCSTLWHQRDPHEAGHIRPNGRSPGMGGFICTSPSWLSVTSSSSKCCWFRMACQRIECYQFRCHFTGPI